MKLTKLLEQVKEKHTNNLKYGQNYCRLNIGIAICTEPSIENVSLWDLLALKEPRMCP